MKKILIVAGETPGSQFQETLSVAGYYTAVVNGARAMIEFCQLHEPDVCLIDLDHPSEDLWTSIQGLKSLRDLANLPLLGVSNVASQETLQKAKEHGFNGLIPKNSTPEFFVKSIQSLFMEAAFMKPVPNPPTASFPSNLDRLTELSTEVIKVADNLKDNLAEFGDDGPELFGYIENAGNQITEKLASVSKDDLTDKEVRHDFRNMIGSVTGFSELILMEPALSSSSQQGLTRLRECSKEFVELLDERKTTPNCEFSQVGF